MKRFIRDIGIFGAIALVLFGGVEWIAESIPNSYTYKRDYMEQHGAEIKTLILGSSYTYDGIAPQELSAAFNLSNSSQTLEDDYRLLARYIEGMDSLQTVLIGVGYSTLAETGADNRRMYYTIYMDLYPRWPISKYSFEVFNLELLTKKIIKYAVSRDVTRCDSLGQRLGHTRAAAEEQGEFWNKGVESLIDNDRLDIGDCRLEIEENTRYMHAIVDLCKAHGVQAVIVQMPVRKEYKLGLPEEQIALQDSVLRMFSDKAICIDASDWEIPEDGWYNATHLTREASVEFTKQLGLFLANL